MRSLSIVMRQLATSSQEEKLRNIESGLSMAKEVEIFGLYVAFEDSLQISSD